MSLFNSSLILLSWIKSEKVRINFISCSLDDKKIFGEEGCSFPSKGRKELESR